MLLSQVFVSSVAGVYNQSLLKSDSASLHAQNCVLYAFGIIINGMIHITIRIVKPGEPTLFAGYTNLPAYLVILSNVFIGLAITAAYKCESCLNALLYINGLLTSDVPRCRCGDQMPGFSCFNRDTSLHVTGYLWDHDDSTHDSGGIDSVHFILAIREITRRKKCGIRRHPTKG